MVKIKIARTPRGFPALREVVGDNNKSLIVLNAKGKRKKGNNKHLIKIEVGDIAVVCIFHNNKYFINIYKILEIDAHQGFMYVDKVADDDDILPEYLIAAVEEAKKLAIKGEL